MLKKSILRTAVVLAASIGIGYLGLVRCSRDNPLDPKSGDYVPGTPPMAAFKADTITGFIWDSIPIPVSFKDTQALGGKTPVVTMLYFNWYGNRTNLNDSVSVAALADSTTVYRVFWLILPNNRAYVQARDNDGNLSPLDSLWLTVNLGRPRLVSASASADTVSLGSSVALTASATDTNGTIRDYVWTVDGIDTATTAGAISLFFTTEGAHTVIVRARDNDWVFSLPDTLPITVIDMTGPEIYFWSPNDGDTVPNSSMTVMVRTRDPSGIFTLWINGNPALRQDTGAYPAWQTWQANVTLTEGINSFPVWSWDKSEANNQTRDTLTLIYRKPDNVPPSIVFSTPQPGDTLRDTLAPAPTTIRVSVTDPSGVAWVRCNDTPMTNSSGNNYELDVLLAEGSDSLVITAQDVQGNGAADTLPVTYLVFRDNTPPSVRVVMPQAGQRIVTDSVQVLVFASDTGVIRSGIASVTVNGTPVTAKLISGIPHYYDTIPLVHGYDTIRAAAVDSSGNAAGDSIVVIRNVAPQFVPNVNVKDTTLWLDSTSTIPVCASDAEGDSMSFNFVSTPAKDTAAQIIAAGPGRANIVYTPGGTTGLDTFRVKVIDAWGSADTLKISASVIPKPSTKPYFTISTLPDTAILDSPYSVQLTAVDPDSQPLVFLLDMPPTPAGVLIDSITGLVTWTPAALGRDTIRAIVRDTALESDTLEWAVTVVLRNMPPMLVNPGSQTVTEGRSLQFTLLASDTNGDALRFSFGGAYPLGATLDSLTGLFNWTPGYKRSGVYPVVFTVTERYRSPALSDSVADTITVKDTNIAPVIVNPGNRTVAEEKALNFNVAVTNIDGDSLRFSMTGAPGSQIDSVTGAFSWVPGPQQAGIYRVTFRVIDNGVPPLADSVFDTITVIDTTRPVFDQHSLLDSVLVYSPYGTTVHASDADGDTLKYAVLSTPDTGFHVDSSSGAVTWRPQTAGAGDTVTVSVTAKDPAGNSATLTWRILVFRWPRIYLGSLTNDTGYSVIQTRDGGYALCGTIATASSNLGFLMRTDTSGNAYVFQTYPGTESQVSLYSIQQTADNGFIMCGTDSSASAGQTTLLLIKTDPSGGVVWRQYLKDTKLTYPSAKGTCVGLTSDNGFIACGAAIRRGVIGPLLAASDAYLVKTDASGRVLWDSMYTNGTQASVAYGVQQTASDSGYIFSGEIGAGGASSSTTYLYLVKTDINGTLLWSKNYGSGVRNVGLSVQDINNGTGRTGYVIGGYSTGNVSGSVNGLLLKVSAIGDTTGGGWIQSLKSTSVIVSVRPVSDGNFIGCGFGAGKGDDVLLYKFAAADGSELWSKLFGTSLSDRGYCAVETSDQGFILTGFVTIPTVLGTTTDVYLVKTDRNGVLSP
jgi:hypothetical protein